MTEISIVVPVYRSSGAIKILYERFAKSLDGNNISFETIFVYDGGPESDWNEIKQLTDLDHCVIGVELSRNFGQHKAITAGLTLAEGNWIVVMDCDLQDNPDDIIKLYHKAIADEVEIVYARRTFRNDTFLKKVYSKAFYSILEYLTDTKQDATIGNFGIYHHKVIHAVLSMNDTIRFLPTMVRWVGFKSSYHDVVHEEREIGKTSYSFRKLIKLALEVILAFSDKPLRLTVKLGLFISFTALVFTIITFIRYLLGDIVQLGYTSIIISIWFLFGLTIFVLGFIGLYVGKTFEQVKQRPCFIIRNILNKKENYGERKI